MKMTLCNPVSFSIFWNLKKIWFFYKKDIQKELIIVSPRTLTEIQHPGQTWNLMNFFLFQVANINLPHIPKSAPMAGLTPSSQIPGTWAFRAEKKNHLAAILLIGGHLVGVGSQNTSCSGIWASPPRDLFGWHLLDLGMFTLQTFAQTYLELNMLDYISLSKGYPKGVPV